MGRTLLVYVVALAAVAVAAVSGSSEETHCDSPSTCNSVNLGFCDVDLLPNKICYEVLPLSLNKIALENAVDVFARTVWEGAGDQSWTYIEQNLASQFKGGSKYDPLPGCKRFYQAIMCNSIITATPSLTTNGGVGDNFAICARDEWETGAVPCFGNCLTAHTEYCDLNSVAAESMCTSLAETGSIAAEGSSAPCYQVNMDVPSPPPPPDTTYMPPIVFTEPDDTTHLGPATSHIDYPHPVTTGKASGSQVSGGGSSGSASASPKGDNTLIVVAVIVAFTVIGVASIFGYVYLRKQSNPLEGGYMRPDTALDDDDEFPSVGRSGINAGPSRVVEAPHAVDDVDVAESPLAPVTQTPAAVPTLPPPSGSASVV